MKTAITTLTALVIMILSMPQAAEAGWGSKRGNWSGAERRSMELQEAADRNDLEVEGDYGRNPDEWLRNWKRINRRWKFRDEDIVWGNEKRPVKSRIIILDPPLEKTVGPDKVEIEWFHSHLDEQGDWKVWVQTWLVVARWAVSMRKAEIPVEMKFRPVGKGPTWLRRYNGQRRAYQELLYAWKEDASQVGKANDVLVELLYSREKLEGIVERSTAEKIVEQAGQSSRRLAQTSGVREDRKTNRGSKRTVPTTYGTGSNEKQEGVENTAGPHFADRRQVPPDEPSSWEGERFVPDGKSADQASNRRTAVGPISCTA